MNEFNLFANTFAGNSIADINQHNLDFQNIWLMNVILKHLHLRMSTGSTGRR